MSINKQHSIADYIARWGNSASIALLDPTCKIFSMPSIEGIIGYRIESNNIIVFGDPLCAPEHVADLALAFYTQFHDTVNNIIYVSSSQDFTDLSLKTNFKAAIGVGYEIILDPTHDPREGTGKKASLLRGKYNQAVRYGVTVHEYTEYDADVEEAINNVGETWIKSRKGLQMYSHHVDIFVHREHKRYFYAKHEDIIVAVLMLNRLNAYQGWVLSFLMVLQEAPKGTSELILIFALDVLRKESCTFFSIGMVPISHLNPITGLGFFTTWFAKNVYAAAKRAFGFGERHRYWKKFHPTIQTSYLVLAKPKIGVGGVLGIMRAFNANV